MKRPSVKLKKLLENHFTFYHSNDLHLWHPESSSADWMMLKNASNQVEQTARDCCSLAHEILAADAGRFKSCISQKLFGG